MLVENDSQTVADVCISELRKHFAFQQLPKDKAIPVSHLILQGAEMFRNLRDRKPVYIKSEVLAHITNYIENKTNLMVAEGTSGKEICSPNMYIVSVNCATNEFVASLIPQKSCDEQ